MAEPGKPAADDWGVEEERLWGTLTTTREFDGRSQKKDPATGLYIGQYPTLPGWCRGYYENVAAAIRGREAVFVTAEQARAGLKVIELARESHAKGCTMAWS